MDGMLIAIGMIIALVQLLLIFLIWKDQKPVWKNPKFLSTPPLDHHNRSGQYERHYLPNPEQQERQADSFRNDGRIGRGEAEAGFLMRNSYKGSVRAPYGLSCSSRSGLNESQTEYSRLKRLLLFPILRQ